MSKRRYRFGIAYFANWTVEQVTAAGYAISLIKKEK